MVYKRSFWNSGIYYPGRDLMLQLVLMCCWATPWSLEETVVRVDEVEVEVL
jgi:hypothetical protein